MTFLRRIIGSKSSQPAQRVRVCSQCGMPVTEHKDWCSIVNGQKVTRPAPATD